MYDWIYSLVLSAVLPIRNIVNDISARISAVWAEVTNVFSRARGQADGWIDHLFQQLPAELRHAIAVINLLRYILVVYVPGAVGQAVASAVTWVMSRVDEVRAFLLGQLNSLVRWASDRLADIGTLLDGLRSWAVARIAEIIAAVNRLLSHVFGPLGSPERLVTWILGALIAALVDWFLDNVDVLAEQAFRRRRGLEDQALIVAGRIIDRFV